MLRASEARELMPEGTCPELRLEAIRQKLEELIARAAKAGEGQVVMLFEDRAESAWAHQLALQADYKVVADYDRRGCTLRISWC
jgi:hypothetical protein